MAEAVSAFSFGRLKEEAVRPLLGPRCSDRTPDKEAREKDRALHTAVWRRQTCEKALRHPQTGDGSRSGPTIACLCARTLLMLEGAQHLSLGVFG